LHLLVVACFNIHDDKFGKWKSCRASEMDTSSGKGSEGVTSVVTDFGTEKQRSFSSNAMGTPSGKGTAGVTSAVSDLETKKQELVEGTAAVQSQGVCTMGSVFFDGDIAFAAHMAGKMHLTQVIQVLRCSFFPP